MVQGGAVLLVLGLLLFTLRAQLGPFVLYLLFLGVLIPFRGQAGHGVLVTLASLLILFWILNTTGFLLAPFVLALVLAYIADPLVDLLERRGVGRTTGILLLAFPLVVGLVLAVALGLPALGGQVSELIDRAPELLDRLADWIEAVDERITRLGAPVVVDQLVDRIRGIQAAEVVQLLQERRTEIAQRTWEGILGIGRGLGSALTILGYVVLTPVLTFYLLRDWDHLVRWPPKLLPPSRREGVVAFFQEYDHLLSRYLRGQVTVALTVGGITALGLWIVQFPFALLLGVIVAVLGVVPYLGLVLSLAPAVLIALVSGNVLVGLLKVAAVYGIAQALEATVISPRIVGESVGLHPVWVVLALAMGGYFFGFVGLLIGVPLAVGVKLLAVRGLDRYRESDLFREEGQEASGE
jgi:predicted PurR-regulated permease PerM